MIFLISSSGFNMYKSHCSCTGNERVSVFVQTEICGQQGPDSCCEETVTSCCSSKETLHCAAVNTDCDCNKPEIIYIKLSNKVVQEEVKFTKVEPVLILVVYASIQFDFWETNESIDVNTHYVDPPPTKDSSLEFLIHIHQLKIPYIA